MKKLTATQLKSRLDGGEEIEIIDIREVHEVDSGHLGGKHIPMAEVMDRSDEIPRNCPVVIHCKSGSRAEAMVYALETQKGFDNLYHLEGGIEAWVDQIDPDISVY